MRVIGDRSKLLKPVRVDREKKIYRLLEKNPELLEKGTQFKLPSINSGPEKGPDFIGVNKKGHLVLGEIKAGPLRIDGWRQLKVYAKRFNRMRERELEATIVKRGGVRPLRKEFSRFLSNTARKAFLNPSRRKLQLVLVAEGFADRVLKTATRQSLGARLRAAVKDVKCVEMHVYDVRANRIIAVADIVSGRRRRLRG